jgi:hypothetical protein
MNNLRPMQRFGPPFSEGFDRSIDELRSDPAGGGGAVGDWPFKLVAVDTTNVKVLFGTVNGITPTGVNTNIDISVDATWTIYLHATLGADGIPTAVEVLSAADTPVPSDDWDDAYILIGEADVSSSVITAVRPSLAWSQTFVACGRDPDDPTTTPGTYYWVVA